MKLRSRINKNVWNLYARWYDFFQPRVVHMTGFFGDLSFDEFHERFVELADLRTGDTVLDVACGAGAAHPEILLKIGLRGQLVGADISSEMLKRAQAKAERLGLKRARYQEAEVEELSTIFGKETFDAVISINGLPQFPNPGNALREMSRVLRPGGRFAASTISRERCLKHPFYWPFMLLAPRLWSQKKLRLCLRQVGLTHLKFVEIGLMLIITAEKRATGSCFTRSRT